MRYLYICVLIAAGSCVYSNGQERLMRAQQKQRRQESIARAIKIRAERTYDDMNQPQKLSYLQDWLFKDIREDLESIRCSETEILYEVPQVTFEEMKEALKDIYDKLNSLLRMPSSDTSTLKDYDRIWAIRLIEVTNFRLLPTTNSTEMLTELQKFINGTKPLP